MDKNFLAKLLSKSNNLCGSGSGRIFALPLTQKKDRFRFHIPGWGCRSRITIFEVSKIRCIHHYSQESSGPKLYVSNRLLQGLTELVISATQGHRSGYGEPIGSWEIFFWQQLHLNRAQMYWPCFYVGFFKTGVPNLFYSCTSKYILFWPRISCKLWTYTTSAISWLQRETTITSSKWERFEKLAFISEITCSKISKYKSTMRLWITLVDSRTKWSFFLAWFAVIVRAIISSSAPLLGFTGFATLKRHLVWGH